jgi:hypothetical protein
VITGFDVAWADDDFLLMLSKLRSVRLTGSFARLEPRDDSDLDFQVSDHELQTIKAYVKERGWKFDSNVMGHVMVDGCEFFSGFHRQSRKGRPATVRINGAEFRTW